MFRSLRTRLTILYASLFGAALILVSLAVYGAISTNATKTVRSDLAASGTVFDRVWTLRSEQLQDGAALLSRDFGFREALATGDRATIGSALENLRARLGADIAFVVGVDGQVAGPRIAGIEASGIVAALQEEETASGVVVINGLPYQTISAPILSPALMGWVVFAVKLDGAEMKALERLSAIELTASVLDHRDGRWASAGGPAGAGVNRLIDEALAAGDGEPRTVRTVRGGAIIGLVKPLRTLDDRAPAVLVLQFPLAKALAPFRPLLLTLFGAGVCGMLLLAAGSWVLARSVTRPLSALDDAARRLQHGETVNVEVKTGDELERLARSFNTMAAEIRERERKITHLALHDAETDLPNRLAMERQIALMGTGADRLAVVAALGIDRFTEVRGAIGYALSAGLMREIGARLSRLHPTRPIARLSNEVLGFVFEAEDLDGARRMAAALQADLEAPLKLGDNTIDISVTVGLAAHPTHADTVAELIERASIALDQARAARQRVAVFDQAAYGDPASNLSLMSEMRRALADGQMSIHHQPKLDLRTGAVTGVEALVRWRHPFRGPLPPDLFVGMAEDTGHIRELTEFVLARAIAEQAQMIEAGHAMAMSVNLSGRLLGDADFAARALETIAGARGHICFEITETAVIDNPDVALQMIDRFAAAGVGISIDDYGSGLSSLAYLKQIRADELKIDKAFIMSMAESQRDALLVRSTIDLAHALGLKVTAEGVETDIALSLLAGMGCDIAQGYLIARPMPLSDLLVFLTKKDHKERGYG